MSWGGGGCLDPHEHKLEVGIVNMSTGLFPSELRYTHMGPVWSPTRDNHQPIWANSRGAAMGTPDGPHMDVLAGF